MVALCAAIFFSLLSQGVISPVLPQYADSFDDRAFLIGAAVGLFGIGRVVMGLPAGFLAQRRGRRAVLVGGTVLTFLGAILVPFSSNLVELMVFRGISGLGGGAYMVGAAIYLRDVSTPETRTRYQSLQDLSIVVGVTVGPFIGGWMADSYGIKSALYLQAVVVLFAVAIAWFWLPETKGKVDAARASGTSQTGPSTWAALKILLSHPGFVVASCFNLSIVAFRQGGRFAIMPLFAQQKGFDLTDIGIFLTVTHIPQFITIIGGGYMSDRFGRKTSIIPAATLIILGITAFIYADNFVLLLLAAVLMGAGEGFVGPPLITYAADVAPSGMVGITMGLYRTIGGTGFLGGALFLGAVADLLSYEWALWVSGVFVAVAAAVFIVVAKEPNRGHSQ